MNCIDFIVASAFDTSIDCRSRHKVKSRSESLFAFHSTLAPSTLPLGVTHALAPRSSESACSRVACARSCFPESSVQLTAFLLHAPRDIRQEVLPRVKAGSPAFGRALHGMKRQEHASCKTPTWTEVQTWYLVVKLRAKLLLSDTRRVTCKARAPSYMFIVRDIPREPLPSFTARAASFARLFSYGVFILISRPPFCRRILFTLLLHHISNLT